MTKTRIAKPSCPYCGKASIDGVTHAKCVRKLGLDGLVSVWEYEGIIRRAILALKYKYSTEVGKELTKVFIDLLRKTFLSEKIDALVPVPIFWYRENVRGFNQCIEVGRQVSIAMNWSFVPDLIIRSKSSTPQVELSGEARRHNLHGVFLINPSLALPDSVVVFDDVFTTGSTLREAAKTLKRAGVGTVWGLTIAR